MSRFIFNSVTSKTIYHPATYVAPRLTSASLTTHIYCDLAVQASQLEIQQASSFDFSTVNLPFVILIRSCVPTNSAAVKMSNDPGQSQDAGGYLLDAQDRHPSMQLQLARAQSTIRSLQIELNNARKTSGDVLETAKDWTNKLKRKYEGEAKELNLEINTLTNVIKETRHLPTIESKADSDSSDANVDRDKIVTRSRKRIKLETRPAMSTTDGNLTSGIPLPPEAGHFYPGKGPAAAPK